MIVLHRPPRHLFSKAGISTSEDVEICYESLQAILRLLRSYSRFYRYTGLPLDFVHTLSVAAGTLLMKRLLENAPAEDSWITKSMDTILHAMDEIKHTWPCIVEIRESIVHAMATQESDQQDPGPDPILDFGFLADFGSGNAQPADTDGLDFQISDADLGLLLTDDFLTGRVSWDDPAEGKTPLDQFP